MYKRRHNFGRVAWYKNDEAKEESQMRLRKRDTCRPVEALVEQEMDKHATLMSPLVIDCLNIHYRIHFEGEDSSSDLMMRLPWPHAIGFPNEKVTYEGGTAKYMTLNTSIITAEFISYGRDSNVGPFFILPWIKIRGDMSDVLAVPDLDSNETQILHLELPKSKLRNLWGSIASCLLGIVKTTLRLIGSLVEVDGDFCIAARPLTQNMSSMIQLAHILPSVLPLDDQTYATADKWYEALAKMHLAQLIF